LAAFVGPAANLQQIKGQLTHQTGQRAAANRKCTHAIAIIKLAVGGAGVETIGETNNKLDVEMQNTHWPVHYN